MGAVDLFDTQLNATRIRNPDVAPRSRSSGLVSAPLCVPVDVCGLYCGEQSRPMETVQIVLDKGLCHFLFVDRDRCTCNIHCPRSASEVVIGEMTA